MKKYCNVCCNTKRTKHLYAIGSILQIGFQDATVWGTGFIDDEMSSLKRILFAKFRKLDVRAVRGPLTRKVLVGMGVSCPEIYGDPAILMPLIYKPKVSTKKKEFVFVAHMHDNTECDNKINILTTDFKKFIDELVLSERVISSSLHGIILAESYGIPAVLYFPENFSNSLFKYCDYYLGTGREKFPIARSISEALTVVPAQLPDLSELQAGLIAAFPKDLWEE